jgi:hypothetical protein
MSDRFQPDLSGAQMPDLSRSYTPLPGWLADRLLGEGEQITWVRGPRWTPAYEGYLTHPALFLAALALAAVFVGAGLLSAGGWSAISPLPVLAAGGIVLGSIFVLGICSGYFTRLVVTNFRLLIVQGYEVCRTWAIDDLPRSMIRYGLSRDGEESRAVDLDTLQTMLGSSSEHFVEAKTIMAFGKQLDRIKAREPRRPDSR